MMARAITLALAWLFIVVGVCGMALGVWRITVDQDLMHGLANVIIGGFVALHGEGNRREAA
jgi:hypothetical protein